MKRYFIFAGIAAFVGCGEFVRYEGDFGSPAATVALDEETTARFAEARQLDHLALSGIMAQHIVGADEAGFVLFDYEALDANPEATLLLDQYLAQLAVVVPANLADRNEKLAYWINAYNAAVIRGVTRMGLDRSVSEDGFRFFDRPDYTFGGVVMTLNQLEHGIIRGDRTHEAFRSAPDSLQQTMLAFHDDLWNGDTVDARIHVALNCAARSCPNLLDDAPFVHRADVLEDQLAQASREFVNNGVKGATPDGISRIFDWFRGDFEVQFGSVAAFIEDHRDNGLEGIDTDRFIEYDWTLNITDETRRREVIEPMPTQPTSRPASLPASRPGG